jgi:hypothetical protein
MALCRYFIGLCVLVITSSPCVSFRLAQKSRSKQAVKHIDNHQYSLQAKSTQTLRIENTQSIFLTLLPLGVAIFSQAVYASDSLIIPSPIVLSAGSSSFDYILSYWRYFLAGSICCSFSHGVSVPFDVLKTRKQVSTELSKMNIYSSLLKIVQEDGFSVLFQGMGPTLVGYAIQGSLKYGFYEIFKPFSNNFLHSLNVDNQLIAFGLASLLAETIGSTFLTPFEASRCIC